MIKSDYVLIKQITVESVCANRLSEILFNEINEYNKKVAMSKLGKFFNGVKEYYVQVILMTHILYYVLVI